MTSKKSQAFEGKAGDLEGAREETSGAEKRRAYALELEMEDGDGAYWRGASSLMWPGAFTW